MAIKVVIGTSEGKCLQTEVEDTKALFGLKIGQTFKGEMIDYPGYEFEITGGSDKIGFAMRKDIDSTARAKILAVEGVGLKKQAKGKRVRKTVAGGVVGDQTAQLNVKVIKAGPKSLFEEPAAEEAPEAPAAEE